MCQIDKTGKNIEVFFKKKLPDTRRTVSDKRRLSVTHVDTLGKKAKPRMQKKRCFENSYLSKGPSLAWFSSFFGKQSYKKQSESKAILWDRMLFVLWAHAKGSCECYTLVKNTQKRKISAKVTKCDLVFEVLRQNELYWCIIWSNWQKVLPLPWDYCSQNCQKTVWLLPKLVFDRTESLFSSFNICKT